MPHVSVCVRDDFFFMQNWCSESTDRGLRGCEALMERDKKIGVDCKCPVTRAGELAPQHKLTAEPQKCQPHPHTTATSMEHVLDSCPWGSCSQTLALRISLPLANIIFYFPLPFSVCALGPCHFQVFPSFASCPALPHLVSLTLPTCLTSQALRISLF